jgi:hypothetical protein
MNLYGGIGLAALGILIVVAGVLNVIPGATAGGVWTVIAGLVVIGLSFIKGPDPEETERMSTAETLTGIFFSPAETFRNLRRHPRWLVAMIIMTIVSTLFMGLFYYRVTPERITNYSIDKTLESPMVSSNEQAKEQIEKGRPEAIAIAKNPFSRAAASVSTFSSYVVGTAFLSAIFFVFLMVLGGKINYWQTFAAVTYAWFPVSLIRSILGSIILFIKDPNQIHPILGQQGGLISDNLGFFVTPSQNPVLFTFLSAIGLISLYWLWLNSTGLRETGDRVSTGSAWTATVSLWAVGILIGMIMAMMFPSFMS